MAFRGWNPSVMLIVRELRPVGTRASTSNLLSSVLYFSIKCSFPLHQHKFRVQATYTDWHVEITNFLVISFCRSWFRIRGSWLEVSRSRS